MSAWYFVSTFGFIDLVPFLTGGDRHRAFFSARPKDSLGLVRRGALSRIYGKGLLARFAEKANDRRDSSRKARFHVTAAIDGFFSENGHVVFSHQRKLVVYVTRFHDSRRARLGTVRASVFTLYAPTNAGTRFILNACEIFETIAPLDDRTSRSRCRSNRDCRSFRANERVYPREAECTFFARYRTCLNEKRNTHPPTYLLIYLYRSVRIHVRVNVRYARIYDIYIRVINNQA